MKKFKKLTAAVAATLMAATMVAPVAMNFVSNAAVDVIVEAPNVDGMEINTAIAVKIFDIQAAGNGIAIADNTSFGDNVEEAILTYLNKGKNEDDEGYISSASDAFMAISNWNNDSDDAKGLAKAIAAINGLSGIEGTVTNGKATFKDLDDGYYIILAEAKSGEKTTQSLGMLKVVNGESAITATAKVALPSVEKKVLEKDDKTIYGSPTYEKENGWNDLADYQIGEEVEFGLYGTLPSNYDEYETYFYEFEDVLDGSKFNQPTDFKVYVNGELETSGYTITGDTAVCNDDTCENKGNWEVKITFDDLKEVISGYDGKSNSPVVSVKYKTSLKDEAVVASKGGQENKVRLNYSNNPNVQGGGHKGTTPWDKVIVYTYDLEVNKTFFNGTDLTKEEIKEGTYSDFKFILKDVNGKAVTVRAVKNDERKTIGEYDYIIDTSVETTDMTLKVYDSDDKVVDTSAEDWYNEEANYSLKIKIKGLDSDRYTIDENQEARNNNDEGVVKYNSIKDVDAEIASQLTYKNNWDENNISVSYSAGGNTNVSIQNVSGVTLPSTGGIGTTLFYLGGGAMVAFAGVALITKKRMGKKEV